MHVKCLFNNNNNNKTWKSQGISLLVRENEDCHKFTYNISASVNYGKYRVGLHLNYIFAECSFKPGYCNFLVIISKVSNYFNKRMSLNSHYYFKYGICISMRVHSNGSSVTYKWSGI